MSESPEEQQLRLRDAGAWSSKEAPSKMPEKDRKKAEKQKKFEEKQAKSLTSAASPASPPSKTKQKKARLESEDSHLPALEWYVGTGEKKGKSKGT